jgi:aminoglycoside 6'-N-acetyltransferase
MIGRGIAFRPIVRGDFELLAQWLSAEHVRVWWHDAADTASIEQKYGPRVDGLDTSEVFVIELDAQPIGLIQRYRFDDNPSWQATLAVAGTPGDACGIDYLIGQQQLIGCGLGPELIQLFSLETWERYPDVQAIVVDVQQGNRRSWRALEMEVDKEAGQRS